MGKNKNKNSKSAKSLNEVQQKSAISALEKSQQRKKVVISVLDSPLDIQWPQIGNENEKIVTELLEKSLVSYRRPSISVSSKELRDVPKEKRKDWRAARQQTTDADESQRLIQKQYIAVGLNKVTRALEKGVAHLVVAERSCDPTLLTRFLIPLCRTKNVPLVPVKQVSSTLTQTLKLPRCLCIAFTAGPKNEENPFKEMLDKLFKISGQTQAESVAENEETKNEDVEMKIDEKCSERVNYYLKKPANGKAAFVPGKLNPLKKSEDFEKISFGSNFLSFGNVSEKKETLVKKPVYREMKIKRLQNNLSKPKNVKKMKK